MPAKVSRLPVSVRRLADPAMWGLNVRFLFISGVALFFGVASSLVYITRAISEDVELNAQEKIVSLRQSVGDIVRNQTESLQALAAIVSTLPEAAAFLDSGDRQGLKDLIVPMVEKVRVTTSSPTIYLHFHKPPAVSFLRTWNVAKFGDDLSVERQMVERCNRDLASLWGLEIGPGGVVLRAITPVFASGRHAGSVEAAMGLADILERMQLPRDLGLALLLDPSLRAKMDNVAHVPDAGGEMLMKTLGDIDQSLVQTIMNLGTPSGRTGDIYFRFFPVEDFRGVQIGRYCVTYNVQSLQTAARAKINYFLWLNISGSLFLWIILAVNVNRLKRFIDKLRKIIIASQQNDFSERFESDHIHCLSVLNCNNTDCPVHADPSLVCYLETGSEAISPSQRNTCIFLKKYGTCDNCAVYKMRLGDEIMDLKNVINTMMRAWEVFLSRVGSLLAEVLRSHETAQHLPSLDQVSDYLEQMAQLTAFSHDLQGVNRIDEVYNHLAYVFERHFGLRHYWIMEIDSKRRDMTLVKERLTYDVAFSEEVMADSDLCRVRRGAEEVASHPNPVLCPYFGCPDGEYVRACLPLVMSGRVGAVVSYVMERKDWLTKRTRLIMLRKYLDESAPVLSSLKLLAISKEQSLRDPLTQCFNRRYLDEFITHYEQLNKRNKRRVGLLMCDVDYFKQVNDQYGHEAGDAVLRQVADVIRVSIRASDMCVRFGGEEFLVLLHEVEPGAAWEVGEKIRQAISRHAFSLPSGIVLHKTISIGTAEFPDDAKAIYKAIKFADVALYAAKNSGRDQVARFVESMWTQRDY